MTTIHDDADVFAVPDSWTTSKWLEEVTREASTSLIAQGLEAALNHSGPDTVPLAPVNIETEGFFKLPHIDLAIASETPEKPEESETSASASIPTDDSGVQGGTWLDSAATCHEPVTLRTWESFNTGRSLLWAPSFLSEAGAGAYDALLSWPTDFLQLFNTDTPVVETKAYFASLLALSLGRESVFFTKDAHQPYFKRVLRELRIAGYTHQVLRGVEKQATWCGTAFLQLTAFSQSLYASSSSRCAIALASAISQVLRAIEHRVSIDGKDPRSLLQLQSTIVDTSAIFRPLKHLADQVPAPYTDKDILQLAFQTASALDFGDELVQNMLCEILRLVSIPWIESMEEWLGTRHDTGMPFTKADVGGSKGFVKVEAETFTDDFGREVEEVDFHLDLHRVPDFMPVEIAEMIFETGRNLRFIRSFHPDHPLSDSGIIVSHGPPQMEWLFDWKAIIQVEEHMSQYQKRIFQTIQQSRLDSGRFKVSAQPGTAESGHSSGLKFLDLGQPEMEEQLLASIHQLSQPFVAELDDGSLHRIVQARMAERNNRTASVSDDTAHWSLVPTLSFGGIASSQATVVNRESLRLLFDAHQIRDHIKLQRDFHLLGSGSFCSRLSHALFDPDLETAERRAGIGMQGGLMGLRLGGRETWPPASSELRLALMGVLSDSYDARRCKETTQSMRKSLGAPVLPGDLSFAVRDLSEEEIDRCMNPDSLEALDFLRLSYTTPAALGCIITPIHLMHYDCIFKLLLRTMRMLFVVNQLHRDTNCRLKSWDEDSVSYRFVRESHHVVCSITSYFLDSGIASPWHAFERKLDDIQTGLRTADVHVRDKDMYSPSQVRDMHSQVLERIMHALFLRKRQQPVLKLLEDMFAIILLYAKQSRLQAMGRTIEGAAGHNPGQLYAELRKKLQVFVTVCRSLSEKARPGGRTGGKAGILFEDFGTGDDSLIAQLLTKLDLSGYYYRDGGGSRY